MLKFPRSEEFMGNILMGSLSSIPSWAYARKLEALNRDPKTPRTTDALGALLESTMGIIRGGNFTANHFIDRECGRTRLRLCLYTSLMRTALYLSEKNVMVSQATSVFHKRWLFLSEPTQFHVTQRRNWMSIWVTRNVFHTPVHFGPQLVEFPHLMIQSSSATIQPAAVHQD